MGSFLCCARYERLAWIPVLIVYLVTLGVGGKHIADPPPAEPATARAILSFAATIAGFVITYTPLGSDFTIYYTPNVSRYVGEIHSYMNLPDRIVVGGYSGTRTLGSISRLYDVFCQHIHRSLTSHSDPSSMPRRCSRLVHAARARLGNRIHRR